MLQYQAGEYCICIWDGEQTRLSRALESLDRYTEDEKATQDHQGYAVTVRTSEQGTDGDKAIEVLEKASNVQGALRYEGQESGLVLYALAETVTACLDFASALGCSEELFQKKLDMVHESNARKEH